MPVPRRLQERDEAQLRLGLCCCILGPGLACGSTARPHYVAPGADAGPVSIVGTGVMAVLGAGQYPALDRRGAFGR